MFCKKCGAQISEDSQFCDQCGASIDHTSNAKVEMNQSLPAKPSKRNTPKGTIIMSVVSVILAAALVASLLLNPKISKSNSSTQGLVTEQGSKDKEELMNRFAKAIADNDYETALSCFPIQTISNDYDYKAALEHLGAWHPGITMQFPSNSDGASNLNAYSFEGQCVECIRNFVFSFLASDDYLGMTTVKNSDSSVDELMSDLDLSKLADLKVVKMQEVNNDEYKSDQSLKIREKLASFYGADTSQEYVVLYELDGTSYVGGVTFLVYGDTYYIYSLNSQFAGFSTSCYVEKMSEDVTVEEYFN